MRSRFSVSQLGPGAGGEFLQLEARFGARIHRMFLNSGGYRLEVPALSRRKMEGWAEGWRMNVCCLAQFSKLFLILCSQQPCELGSVLVVK